MFTSEPNSNLGGNLSKYFSYILLTNLQTASWTSQIFPKNSFDKLTFIMYARANYYSWGSDWQEDGQMKVNLIDAKTNDTLWSKTIRPRTGGYTSTYKTGDYNTAYETLSDVTLNLKDYNADEFKIVMTGNGPLKLTDAKIYFK